MLYVILSTVIMLALLDRTLRGGRIRLLKLDFRFRLFELRDELRLGAISGEIRYNNWFDYMDTTLTRTTGRIDAVNPWLAAGYLWANKNNVALRRAHEELKQALARPENRKIAEVYDKYTKELSKYLSARHTLSWPLAARLFGRLCQEGKSSVHDTVEEEEQQLAPVFSITPQTSTFWEYSPSVSHAKPSPAAEVHMVAR